MKFAWTKETKDWTQEEFDTPILTGLLQVSNNRDQESSLVRSLSSTQVTTKVRSEFINNSHLHIDVDCWEITGY